MVKLRRPDGTQYSKTFRTRNDAKAFEVNEQDARNKGTWINDRSASITFGVLVDMWFGQNTGKRQKSLDRDIGILNKHLMPTLKNRSLSTIKKSEIQTLVDTWNGNGLKPRTIQRHIAVLKAIFQKALDDDLLNKSPVRAIKIPKAEPIAHHPLDEDEVARLLEAVSTFYRPLLYIFLTTGLRWSELAGLQIRDVTLIGKSPELRVERGLHNTSKGFKFEAPKSNAGKRTWPLSQQQVASIAFHIASTERTGANGEESLFVSPTGHMLNYSNFRTRIFLPALEKAGILKATIHDIRRTTATVLVAEQVDLKTIQELMGHADIRTTLNIYASATPQGRRMASEALEAFVGPHCEQMTLAKGS
jgi:integrase